LSATSGPEALPRTSPPWKLPYGPTRLPVYFPIDGRALMMLMMPPSALRP